MYSRRATTLLVASVVLACLVPVAPASAQGCDVTANVVALDQVLVYNRLGAYAPTGMIFALERDVFPMVAGPGFHPDTGPFTLANSCASVACIAGQVQVRPDKRPRPLTLRANEGDTLCVNFTNLLNPTDITDAMNEAPGVGVSGIQSEQPVTRHAGVHIHGMQWTASGGGDDASNVGGNTPSLVAPGGWTSYAYYAQKEGAYVISGGPDLGGEGGNGAIANGLFGVLNVEPPNAEWYRSQMTRVDLEMATPAEVFDDQDLDGVWDQDSPEPFVNDWNGNGTFEANYPESFINDWNGNGTFEANYPESFINDWNGNGTFEASYPEPFEDTLVANGVYDPGEPFTDWNGNGFWDADLTDEYTDWNGNLIWDASLTDEYNDWNTNGAWDSSLTDEYTDWNSNGLWDASLTDEYIDYSGDGAWGLFTEPVDGDTNGDGIWQAHRVTPAGQPILDYDAVYPDGHPYAGAPIVNIVDSAGEIVHNEINAIITGPGQGAFPSEGAPTQLHPYRGRPFRELTVAFHDEVKVVQAFKGWFDALPFTLGGVVDGFAINYGTGGIGSEIIGNRLGVGPMHECVECKYEEFFLTSWAVGDPAMIVDVPANAGLELLAPGVAPAPAVVGPKASKVFYPDDPSNVWHGYLNDRTKVRNIHVGTEHHIFHLHAHQWLFSAIDEQSNYIDAQALGPGSSFSYEITFGGAGNRNKTVGDSIFHCHFYPHFAQGMWGLWRVHDSFEMGSVLDGDGRVLARGLVDGEIPGGGYDAAGNPIPGGTPIPAVVPLPGQPMAPMPGSYTATVDADDDGVPETEVPFMGYPFYIAGEAGHRPPTPPLDLIEDGGLPRHVITGGAAVGTQTPVDFSKVLEVAQAKRYPETGTPEEKAAMAFHGPQTAGVYHDSYLPDNTPAPAAAGFEVNGLPPVPGAPYAEPCRSDFFDGGGTGYIMGYPRHYKASVIELDTQLNKVGWHFTQQRMIVLDGDVADSLAGTRAPEPFVMRANTGDCVTFDHTNLVPHEYQLDDFQVRTPTDVIGQHIHLVKFDVTSADGAANGWNYEDGTLSPNEVQERINAINGVHAADFPGAPYGLIDLDSTIVTGLAPTAGPANCPTATDAASVHLGFSGCQGARTTRQRWYIDPGWGGNIFTHDHYGPSTHQQVGLYGTMLVEPKYSTWRDPVTGLALGDRFDGGPTSWRADILTADGDAWREFYLEFADFQLAYRGEDDGGLLNGVGTPVNPSDRKEVLDPWILEKNCVATAGLTGGPNGCMPEAISAADPGTFVVNMRNEPLAMRLRDPGTNQQAPGLAGDLSFAYQSRTDRADGRLNTDPWEWPYNSAALIQTPNEGAFAGDPFTPIMRVYEGDKVHLRVQVGGQEEGHNFSMHGVKWLQQWASGSSGFRNSQMAGISEYFIFDVPALGRVRGDQDFEDYLYQTGSSVDARWNGTWGVMRSYKGSTPDVPLQPLPTNPDGSVPPGNNGDFAGMCPQMAPSRPYAIAAVSAADVLPDLAGNRPGTPGFAGGTLVYNSRTTAGGPLHDPTALMYVLESDLEPIDPADPLCIQQKGNPRNPKIRTDVMKPGCTVRLRADAPVEPLILRANAGDCLRVELFNKTLQQAVDSNGLGVFTCSGSTATAVPLFEDLGLGLCLSDGMTPAALPVTFDGPFDLDGSNTLPMIVEQFNANQIAPSTEVGLHAQLVSFTMSEGDGANVGFNNVQTAPPGSKAEYVWYAGSIDTDPETGFRTPTPVEFGAINLMASDPIKGSNKGLIGGLVVEPQDSTWQCDAGFQNNGRLKLVDCYGGGKQGLPTTRAAATISVGGNNGTSFRDFVAIYQDDVNLRFGSNGFGYAANDPVPTVAEEAEPEDSGQKGINYRTEPSWFRLGYAPTGDSGFTRTVDYTDIWSNGAVGGDPETPVFYATKGDEIRFRLLKPGGHNRNQVFALHGHLWPRHPFNADSTEIDRNNPETFWHGEQMGHGPANHVNVVPLNGAGGLNWAEGDYLFRDMVPVHVDNGEWGILRVTAQ